MEKSQTGHSRAWCESDNDLAAGELAESSLQVIYLSATEWIARRSALAGKLLGAVAFGPERPVWPDSSAPHIHVEVNVVGDAPIFELWVSESPVAKVDTALVVKNSGISAARNDDTLFGCLQVDAADSIEASANNAYSAIFEFIDRVGYGHLLRVWNYFPHINEQQHGLERYRGFTIGRHEAFVANGRAIADSNDIPAACALGSRGGPLLIYFLAGKQPGIAIENPRQISAYHYPAQYGPRSPVFARALLTPGAKRLLFISGTASIVGHETQHHGSAVAQAEETCANIRAVIDEAVRAGLNPASESRELLFKAYLRQPEYQPLIAVSLQRAFGPRAQVIYLQADICRTDLLVEVEGVCIDNGGAAFAGH